MNRKLTLIVVLASLALAVTSAGMAAPLKIGDAAPDFSGIPGTDGKQHGLADYKKAKVVVVVFTCNHCPVAVVYEDRLIALQKAYGPKGVQVLAVCVNDRDGDRLDDMKKRAKDKGFNFPYIYDASQKSAREYGATCTPHAFALDKGRKIAYMGAIDDSNNPDKVKTHYLKAAIDALLAGKEPPQTTTRQRGCGIKWSKKKK